MAAGERHPLAACVGQFHLPDREQLAWLRSAFARADRVLVFVTRAFQAPSARHPFAWRERAAMLEDSLDAGERARVAFEPVREHWDPQRTVRAVQARLAPHVADSAGARVLCLWSEALRDVHDWPASWSVETRDEFDARGERRLDALYATDEPLAALQEFEQDLAPGARDAVRKWLDTPEFGRLREEWRQIAREKKAWSAVPYPVTLVTVDAIVRAGGHVLLIERGRPPGKGLWAIPGGFLESGDTVLQSALRELVEETGLPLGTRDMHERLRGVKVFDHPGRSQRGRIVAHAHFFDLGEDPPPPVRGGDDAAAAKWVPIEQLASMETRLHDDHFHMLDMFLGLTADP